MIDLDEDERRAKNVSPETWVQLKTVQALTAERDAALAAIERVRAVLAEERAWLEHLVESGDALLRVVIGIGKVEAALDGAPEPEDGSGYRYVCTGRDIQG